jgi:hypothetical protein
MSKRTPTQADAARIEANRRLYEQGCDADAIREFGPKLVRKWQAQIESGDVHPNNPLAR